MKDKPLFFPVQNTKFSDLYNWADKLERNKTTTRTIRINATDITNLGTRDGTHEVATTIDCIEKSAGTKTSLNEVKIALFRYGTDVYAVREKCPHAGGPLHFGDIEVLPDMSLCVRCPWHSWRFHLETGKVVFPKCRTDVQMVTYPVKVQPDGGILIGFDQFAKEYFQKPEDYIN